MLDTVTGMKTAQLLARIRKALVAVREVGVTARQAGVPHLDHPWVPLLLVSSVVQVLPSGVWVQDAQAVLNKRNVCQNLDDPGKEARDFIVLL